MIKSLLRFDVCRALYSTLYKSLENAHAGGISVILRESTLNVLYCVLYTRVEGERERAREFNLDCMLICWKWDVWSNFSHCTTSQAYFNQIAEIDKCRCYCSEVAFQYNFNMIQDFGFCCLLIFRWKIWRVPHLSRLNLWAVCLDPIYQQPKSNHRRQEIKKWNGKIFRKENQQCVSVCLWVYAYQYHVLSFCRVRLAAKEASRPIFIKFCQVYSHFTKNAKIYMYSTYPV